MPKAFPQLCHTGTTPGLSLFIFKTEDIAESSQPSLGYGGGESH